VAGRNDRPDGPASIDGAVAADTVRRMRRSCARPECSSRANATLSYDYADSSVILGPLADEPHPMSHDLCEVHADSMSVPRGWRLEDRRNVTDLPMSPSESEAGSGSASESVAS
jgi:hypothetical protein